MADYNWPVQGTATLLGGVSDRIDGIEKASGVAKYSYDITPPRTLMARMLGCPHAHCKIKSIDTTAAEKVPGVVAIELMKQTGNEIRWQGDLIACVAAENEAAASEGCAAIKVDYEMLDVFVDEADLEAATAAKRTGKGAQNTQLENEPGDDDDETKFNDAEIARLLKESDVVVEGEYGIHAITHMCLEPHGSTCLWNGDKLVAHLSTQNVSGTAAGFAGPLGITADDVTVHCDFIGGGFGSKFQVDTWGVVCAQVAKKTGRPVKLMLTRDQELKNGGCRPSIFIKVKVGADKNGVVKVWDSQYWGSSGAGGGGVSQDVVPYVFNPANRRRVQTTVDINASPSRAWRAPNHPQGCAVTQTAYDDIAAKLGLDSYDVFLANLDSVSSKKSFVNPATGAIEPPISCADDYREEMRIAAELMGWKSKWHPHGKGPKQGSVVTGLGMAIHTWGGAGSNSTCNLKVHPDGGVETFLGSQDLGTGTRTVIAMVVAETFGLPVSAVKVNIGSSKYPASGPSGGSTTVGGICESNRRASQDALRQICDRVAKKLGVEAAKLVAKNGRIGLADDDSKSLSWKEACSLLGMAPLETQGNYVRGQTKTTLSSAQVAGVQMAEVAVDLETGVVKMKKYVAVQDIGLVVNRKTAASQIYGAAIMGIAFSLFEERIMDSKTGAFLNCEIADYKLPRMGDIGEIVVEFYEPAREYNRGVVGLGEPPVVSPGAAISNAVCNAIGTRVPVLPITPARVLKALQRA